MTRTPEDFVHKGSYTVRWGMTKYEPDLSRCRVSVYENDRVGSFHQCNRKPVKEIGGYGFCKIHADEVETKLGIREASGTKYAASWNHGSPTIVELEIAGETDTTIEILKTKSLMGHNYGLYKGKSNKNSQYTRRYEFFDSYNDALLYLYRESEGAWRDAEKNLEDSIETMNKLAEMVRELNTEEL